MGDQREEGVEAAEKEAENEIEAEAGEQHVKSRLNLTPMGITSRGRRGN